MDGILIIDKEKDCTSRDVVNMVSKILKTKKIGHTGTLDPLATGVLVLCIGKATKLVEILTSEEKEYEAEVRLGIKTDTLDITGNVLETREVNVSKKEVLESLLKQLGKQIQEVPLYSAVKIKGKKLYEYARNNEEVVLPKREIEVKEIELISDVIKEDGFINFTFRALVSKGTYIRSLIEAIASSLDTVGVMTNLRRIRQGHFNIKDSYKLEDLVNNNYQLLPIDDSLKDLYTIIVDEELASRIKNGVILDNIYHQDVIYFKDCHNIGIAIYKKYDKDINKIKPWKMFT